MYADLVWPLGALTDGELPEKLAALGANLACFTPTGFPAAYAGYADRGGYPGYPGFGYPFAGMSQHPLTGNQLQGHQAVCIPLTGSRGSLYSNNAVHAALHQQQPL